MIQNIILDMGNVLLAYDPSCSLNAFLDSEEDKKVILKELYQGPEWVKGDLGLIQNKERFEGVAKRIPSRLHGGLRQCVDNWWKFMTPMSGAKEFCEYVKAKKYGIYILSNACNMFYEYFPQKFLPLDFFDGIVVSSDVHMVKPNIRIYEYLLKQYGLLPGECFFIDDRIENVEGAKNARINGAVFHENFEEMKVLLNKQQS